MTQFKTMCLTDEAQLDRAEFYGFLDDEGCRCFISPPCRYCTHPGNPKNQADCDDCWQDCIVGHPEAQWFKNDGAGWVVCDVEEVVREDAAQ